MIERDYPVISCDSPFRGLEFIDLGLRQAFESTPQLITKHHAKSTLEWRQTGNGGLRSSWKFFRNSMKLALVFDSPISLGRMNLQTGIRGDVGIATAGCVFLGGIEEKQVW